jgi:hypothetical protein
MYILALLCVDPIRFVALRNNSFARARAPRKDVLSRTFVPEVTSAQRSQCGKLARAAAKRNRSTPFNGGGFFEPMAEAS